VLALVLFGAVLGATVLGVLVGRRVSHLSESLREPYGVLQAAMLGVVGLILAFGLSLAVSRYENRRAAIVDETNRIGTTYLRAQTLPEPIRSRSLALLVAYTESAVRLSEVMPGSEAQSAVAADEEEMQRKLWALAGKALDGAPEASAPRLYVETLNEMIDAQTTRVAALNNQVPTAILFLEILGASFALALLAAYLTLIGRGVAGVLAAAVLVGFLLLVTADLDRPTRGLIQIPDTVLEQELESMKETPAAAAPAARSSAAKEPRSPLRRSAARARLAPLCLRRLARRLRGPVQARGMPGCR
jgi:hypothetical protein